MISLNCSPEPTLKNLCFVFHVFGFVEDTVNDFGNFVDYVVVSLVE